MSDLAGSVALVTGASRGIGQATAILLARRGCDLALVARTEAGLRETAKLCIQERSDARVLIIPVDLCLRELLPSVVDRCVAELGRINILIANAGIYSSDIERAFEINALSAFRLTELCAPAIRRDAASRKSGIIYIASLASKMTFKGGAAFCASKHAVLGYAGCVYEDLREEGIKVCSIMPGFVNTSLVNSRVALDGRLMVQPEDIAEACAFVLLSSDTACPTEITIRPQHTPYKANAQRLGHPATAAARTASTRSASS